MSIKKQALLGVALATVIALPAHAAEGKKMKEITSIVGYNVIEQQVITGPKAELYQKIDTNDDGNITFKEYSNFSNLDNEYDAFIRMDKDGNKNISYNEFAIFNNTGKGTTEFESALHGKASVKGTNLKSRILQEPKQYYVPVEPEVVDIKDIEPAAK